MRSDLFRVRKPVKGRVPETNTVNLAGGAAYALNDEEALAQLACTGTFNATFYADGESQLKNVCDRIDKVSPEFLAKLTLYSRENGLMKDMPAVLLAFLMTRDAELFASIFHRVVNNFKMVQNFFQAVQSGQTFRPNGTRVKSFSRPARRLLSEAIRKTPMHVLFKNAIGSDPSLSNMIKGLHILPLDKQEEAFFGYIRGKFVAATSKTTKESVPFKLLPESVQKYEEFKANSVDKVPPDVGFMRLAGMKLTQAQWEQILYTMGWHALRINARNLHEKGVFNSPTVLDWAAAKLADHDEIKKARVFPHQVYTAHKFTEGVPDKLRRALEVALDHSAASVPLINGKVLIGVDCSSSMTHAITGTRKGATSKTSCAEAAALMAACFLTQNPSAEIIFFNDGEVSHSMDPSKRVMTNVTSGAPRPSGGTAISIPLKKWNERSKKGDAVIIISDNQSWVDSSSWNGGTSLMKEWATFKGRNPKAKLICMDLAPSTTAQATNDKSILNIGGFSDSVFEIMTRFANESDNWVDQIRGLNPSR